MEIIIKEMVENDIDSVVFIDNACFSVPWTKFDFRREFNENAHIANYFIAVVDSKVVGFAGVWHIINEGHITNVAVLPEYRKNGIAKMLVEKVIEFANINEMIGITLEVRISNTNAQKLYTQFGFKIDGFRKNYYKDPSEDAVIMWKTFDRE